MNFRIQVISVMCLLWAQVVMGQKASEVISADWVWENLGPNRGGRSIAVAGHPDRPNEYFFGATGGGIWKTSNGGQAWHPVSDGQLQSSSVGALAIAPSNPDVIYAGMGESQLRGNIMQGDGIYRSQDAGRTWTHQGLKNSKTIGQILVHPKNEAILWVAVLGDPYTPSEERGIFKSIDGGNTWSKILYQDSQTGAVDLILDPVNPDILYASFWHVYRKPWILWSGGEGSAIFKSTDGGSSWTDITKNHGLPNGTLGKIALAVSPAMPERVYANIEAIDGGLYRSDDGGASWQLMNNHRDLWQRSFYFMRIEADPLDPDVVYIMNFVLMQSTDGGKSFKYLRTPHADHHDLWIDPQNPERMVVANDGGASVSVDGGKSWTSQDFPTAQIYRLTVTEDFPYHVCGAQQDNTTVCVSSDGGFLTSPQNDMGDWMYAVGGGENAYIATKPGAPNIFYSAATNALTRFDRNTGATTYRHPFPYMVMGEPASAMPERWNWVYPIAFSPLAPHRLYVGSQHLWESEDEGYTWRKISSDLTLADPETLGDSGGPIIKDQDGPEIYATLFTIAPSRFDADVIYTGSDDGLVHITRDRGKTWNNITPSGLPEHSRIGMIVASKHNAGTAYLAARRYEMGDRKPYVYKTSDYGETWTEITSGVSPDHFAHVINEDPKQVGLLYLGTEHGPYVSFDDGQQWHLLQGSLPDVHISGIAAEERDLVISTHGRGFYALRNIGPLRAVARESGSDTRLFKPIEAVRGVFDAAIQFYLGEDASEVQVLIKNADNEVIKRFEELSGEKGLHKVTWNLRYPGATVFENIILEGPVPRFGPLAVPGNYVVELRVDNESQQESLVIKKDPRLEDISQQDLEAQFELAMSLRDLTSLANEHVMTIRNLKEQLAEVGKQTNLSKKMKNDIKDLSTKLSSLEDQLYQVKNQSPKDKIAYPIRLNNRISGLYAFANYGDQRPPKSLYEVKQLLEQQLMEKDQALTTLLDVDLRRLNSALLKIGLTPIKK